MTHPALLAFGTETRTFLESLQKAHRYWSDNLCGACGVGAYLNWKLFTQHGFQASLIMADNFEQAHCWTEVRVGHKVFVVDTTATQFGPLYNKVLILPVNVYLGQAFIQPDYKFYRDQAAIRLFKEAHWLDCQRPDTFKRESRKFLRDVSSLTIGFKAA